MRGSGRVYLVGAGPGATDLVTLRGLRAIRSAEVLVCDDLIPRNFLEALSVPAEGREVHWLSREGHAAVDELMTRPALAGRIVVRLKNGDPFVFGRGWEETESLSALGIPWEVIPAPSSCLAAPALAGVPLTRRGKGRSFAVAPARLAGGALCPAFPRADSLVILMGVGALVETVERLIDEGWAAGTPAMIVERASLPWERRVEATLAEIPAAAVRACVSAPAVLVVGDAAGNVRRTRSRPRVLFTGLDPARFRHLGNLLHWPALELARNLEGLRKAPVLIESVRAGRFSWVVFTGTAGVRSFFEIVSRRGLDARVLAAARVAAAGGGTEACLREHGLRTDATVSEGGADGILQSLGPAPAGGGRVLVVEGSHAPGGLGDALLGAGWKPAWLATHKVVPHPGLGRPLPERDAVLFISPAGVRAWRNAYGAAGFAGELWCLGPATANAVAKAGGTARILDGGNGSPAWVESAMDGA